MQRLQLTLTIALLLIVGALAYGNYHTNDLLLQISENMKLQREIRELKSNQPCGTGTGNYFAQR